MVLLAAIAYTVILDVVDWAAVGLLAYPAEAVAPFAVISGAILTVAIIVPTALITVNRPDELASALESPRRLLDSVLQMN